MIKKIGFAVFVLTLLLSALIGARFAFVVNGSPNVIVVPNNFPTIQAAINAANSGDTIQVLAGTYSENVFVNKTVSLIGASPATTIIDAGGTGSAVIVNASNVEISGFTLTNSGNSTQNGSGLRLFVSSGNKISNNLIVMNNYVGLELIEVNSSSFFGNTIANNSYAGLRIGVASKGNVFFENLVANNSNGVWVTTSSFPLNTLYHNNFVNNANQALLFGAANWDNGAEGNYWSGYDGQDLNGDGIGDTPYPGEFGWDRHPLMQPWSRTRVFPAGAFQITVESNSTIASFSFNQALRRLSFKVTGPAGKTTFCNVTVPKGLLSATSAERWRVLLNSTDVSSTTTVVVNASASSIFFQHGLSTYNVQIRLVKIVVANFTWSPTAMFVGDVLTFNASASVPSEGTIDRYVWNFGDGTTVTEADPIATHVFLSEGTFNVTLNITDSEGLTASKLIRLTIKTPPFNYTPYILGLGIVIGVIAVAVIARLKTKKKQ